MIIEQAKVIHYQNGIALIQCFTKSSCGGCQASYQCGTKALSALSGEKQAGQFQLPVNTKLVEGDLIEIAITERHLLISVFWLYFLPLVVLLSSTLIFSIWLENELYLASAILFSTVMAFQIIKQIVKRQPKGQFIPRFLRKL